MHLPSCLAALLVALKINVVHTRSLGKKLECRNRAIALGFVEQKEEGTSHVRVRSELASRMKVVAKSMKVHHDHCLVSGRDHHFAMHAALAVRHATPDHEFHQARSLHKRARVAKHSWADNLDEQIENSKNDPRHFAAKCGDSADSHFTAKSGEVTAKLALNPDANELCPPQLNSQTGVCCSCSSWQSLALRQHDTIGILSAHFGDTKRSYS